VSPAGGSAAVSDSRNASKVILGPPAIISFGEQTIKLTHAVPIESCAGDRLSSTLSRNSIIRKSKQIAGRDGYVNE
jgi:hypothetical protein